MPTLLMEMPFQIIIFILLKVIYLKCQLLTVNCTPNTKAIIVRGRPLTRTKLWHYRVWLGAVEPHDLHHACPKRIPSITG